jgi:hypothetical protein
MAATRSCEPTPCAGPSLRFTAPMLFTMPLPLDDQHAARHPKSSKMPSQSSCPCPLGSIITTSPALHGCFLTASDVKVCLSIHLYIRYSFRHGSCWSRNSALSINPSFSSVWLFLNRSCPTAFVISNLEPRSFTLGAPSINFFSGPGRPRALIQYHHTGHGGRP